MVKKEKFNWSETADADRPPPKETEEVKPMYKATFISLSSYLCALLYVGTMIYICFKNGVTVFSFHPVVMAIAWTLLVPTAINAITPGDVATEWVPLRPRTTRHWAFLLVSALAQTVGLATVVAHQVLHDKPHFAAPHPIAGLLALVFMVLSSAAGIVNKYRYNLQYYLSPTYTELIHAALGLFTFALGMLAIILSFFARWWSFGDAILYRSLTLVLAVLVCTESRPAMKIYYRVKEIVYGSNKK